MKDFFETVPYTHSEFPIYIQKESFYASTPFTTHINWHNDVEFVKVLRGKMNFNINGEVFALSEGQGLFINANQVHYNFSCKEHDCEFICIIFQPSMLCAKKHFEEQYILPILFNKSIPYYILNKDVAWQNDVIHSIESIYHSSTSINFELELHSEFFSLWNNIYKNLCNTNTNKASNEDLIVSFKKMMSYIEENYKNKISLHDICLAGNVCKTTCNKIFKTYTGYTPIVYLTNHRLKKAIELMESNNLTLTQISYECGFGGASYFAETFKKNYGLSPKKYKLIN